MMAMLTGAQSSSCGSGGRNSVSSSSPEFEFWMLRNPSSFPETNLLSADELFAGGVLLPLLPPSLPLPLPLPSDSDPDPDPHPKLEPEPGPQVSPSPESSSKRWRDIFKKIDKKPTATAAAGGGEHGDKDKKRERKRGGGGATSAELNIYLWPFSRSRSAGGRPRTAVLGGAASRKVSSAPCSRSNSAGESNTNSNSRKWPCSPGRPGVHLGRSSPVWQVRRRSSHPLGRHASAGGKKEGSEGRQKNEAAAAKARVLNLNVPTCIGYRHHSCCRGDENAAGEGGRGSPFFNLRALFSKKVF